MTFKDLQKVVQSQQSGLTAELSTIPKDLPFWIFDKEQHRLEDIRTKGTVLFLALYQAATKGRERYAGPTISKDFVRSTSITQTYLVS